jgi:glyoxylase-like metal-dependent hydrolase (beta-lactamase superfamily II)
MGTLDSNPNVFTIDTKMFGFDQYQSCYVVVGNEVALVDAGIPSQLEAFKLGMEKHGFSIRDVSKIILTHCEHPDHAGNVGSFVKENPNMKVYINPVGLEFMTNPEIEAEFRKKVMLPEMAARFGVQLPVPKDNIELLKDGDVIDLGGGETLKVAFTPAHQPSGLVLFEEKNNGLFINDLVGNYFDDIDFNLVLTPPRSDVLRGKQDLQRFSKMNIKYLYRGHFGISKRPQEVIKRALKGIERIMDISEKCVQEQKPEEIEKRVYASQLQVIEPLKKRSDELYEYTKNELITHHAVYFQKYYLELVKKRQIIIGSTI